MDTEKIFDKYYRVENSYNHTGTGLRLYICKKFVEEMHGNITAYYKEDTLNIKIDFMSADENQNTIFYASAFFVNHNFTNINHI